MKIISANNEMYFYGRAIASPDGSQLLIHINGGTAPYKAVATIHPGKRDLNRNDTIITVENIPEATYDGEYNCTMQLPYYHSTVSCDLVITDCTTPQQKERAKINHFV